MHRSYKDWVIDEAESIRTGLISLSRAIHSRPELGMREFFASQLLSDFLESKGFQVTRGFCGIPTAFSARFKAAEGPTVAFLAEYDALPELGHACGHNLIGTAAVGAAAVVSRMLGQLGGTAVVLGTPAEETNGAKVTMVEAGAFNGIDAAMMFHPGDSNAVEINSLAMEALEFTFWGKSVHAAACPQLGINALEALILFFNGVNSLRQYLRDEVCIHGIIVDGGISPNVIPERATARFYIRARQQEHLGLALEKIKTCASGAAAMIGARVEWRNFEFSYQNMISNPTLAGLFRENLKLLGVRNLAGPREALGSIDMGNVSQVVPSLHPYLALNGKFIPHSREFALAAGSEVGEAAMMLAVKALACTAVDLYMQPVLVEKARAELVRLVGR